MRVFDWMCNDKLPTIDEYIKNGFKAEPEPQEQKGLEIVTITPPEQIKVKVDGDTIGAIESIDGVYKFRMFATSIYSPPSYSVFNSDSLKSIAAKLDELNGVERINLDEYKRDGYKNILNNP